MTASLEKQLILRAVNDNCPQAFAALVRQHQNRLRQYLRQLCFFDPDFADDLAQETFIKAIKTIKSGRYNEEGKFLPWISRIAHNMAIDYFRKQKRYPTIVMEDGSHVFNTLQFSEDSIESKQIKQDTHAKLRELIQELPESQKEVLMMRHYMEMSFQEIAETTGVSINTALGRMRYALINLRKKMKQYNIAYDQNIYPR